MKLNNNIIISFFFLLLMASCQNKESKTAGNADTIIPADSAGLDTTSTSDYAEETTNEETAARIKTFLVKAFEKDLKFMDSSERKFSFYEIDLNDDKKSEYFVKTTTCGSGGCSFYLLNNDFTINTYFTVTRPPFFISSEKTGGWHDLILKGDTDKLQGVKNYIHLKFDKTTGKYPSNPSLIEKIDLAPNGHDFVMWDDEFSNAKPFSF